MANDKPSILAIETATSSCSVALLCDGHVFEQSEVGNNIHSKVVLQMVKELLIKADLASNKLDAVAVGQGPGSFTGLRIGIGVAQGIAYGVDCPMIGVSSLDALANQASREGWIVAGIDARMGEIYWCEYHKSGDELQRIGQLMVTAPLEIATSGAASYELVGNAWSEYKAELSEGFKSAATINTKQFYPCADSLLNLALRRYHKGECVSSLDFAPEYVRNDVAKKSSKAR